jgi:putative nucleotidyltransferase with HDIG domain
MTTATLTPRDAAPAASRLHHLFRTSLREGLVHPLWRLMHARRPQQDGVAACAIPPTTAAPLPRHLSPDQIRARVADLPCLPQAVMRALQTLRRDDASVDDIAADISCDASLVARLLRLANSPFYGVSGRVASARSAVQILGRRTLESMLVLATVMVQMKPPCSRQFDVAAYWRHALATAIVARGLARSAGLDEDQAFIAGLLHDLGLLAMSVHFPEALDSLIACARAEDEDLSMSEKRHALTPHAEVGAWIAAHWHFPPAVVQAVAAHHAPSAPSATPAPGAAKVSLADCVHAADAIARALDVAGVAHDLVPNVDVACWLRLGLKDDEFERLCDEAEQGLAALCKALSL